MSCEVHLIALITVLNQSVWLFDQTRGCGLMAPAGFFEPPNQIYAQDVPEPMLSSILAHEFCHQKAYLAHTNTGIAFVDESFCYLIGFYGLTSQYQIMEYSKVHNEIWITDHLL